MSSLKQIADSLNAKICKLKFSEPVTHVYNPMIYAEDMVNQYFERFGGGTKNVLFLGMNPGPFGMAQTGIPFGEISAVRDWIQISGNIGKPKGEHPDRPVTGMECHRSEVSGQRIWGLFKDKFGTPEVFFKDHFVT